MDETEARRRRRELLIILAAIADEKIPIQTIAPKFTGRFNKGVDYVGDVAQFEKEFSQDLAVIAHAVDPYGLPANLKLSVHSGSDKFSIYGAIRARAGAERRRRPRQDGGHHLARGADRAGGGRRRGAGAGERSVRRSVRASRGAVRAVRRGDRHRLCKAARARGGPGWTADEYTSALRHDQSNPGFNPNVRQLLHVGYKVAAKMGPRYLRMLDECEESISRNVTENLFERHIQPLFLD